eukprot:gene9849-biopygen9284
MSLSGVPRGGVFTVVWPHKQFTCPRDVQTCPSAHTRVEGGEIEGRRLLWTTIPRRESQLPRPTRPAAYASVAGKFLEERCHMLKGMGMWCVRAGEAGGARGACGACGACGARRAREAPGSAGSPGAAGAVGPVSPARPTAPPPEDTTAPASFRFPAAAGRGGTPP